VWHGLIGPNGAGKTTHAEYGVPAICPPVPAGCCSKMKTSRDGRLSVRAARAGIRRTFQNLKLFREMTALEKRDGRDAWTDAAASCGTRCCGPPAQRAEEASIERQAARRRSILSACCMLPRRQPATLSYGIAAAGRDRPRLRRASQAVCCSMSPPAGLNGAESRRLVDLIRSIRATGVTIMLVEHPHGCRDADLRSDHGAQLRQAPGPTVAPGEIRRHPDVIKAYLGRWEQAARHGRSQARPRRLRMLLLNQCQRGPTAPVAALRNVSLEVKPGEIVAPDRPPMAPENRPRLRPSPV